MSQLTPYNSVRVPYRQLTITGQGTAAVGLVPISFSCPYYVGEWLDGYKNKNWKVEIELDQNATTDFIGWKYSTNVVSKYSGTALRVDTPYNTHMNKSLTFSFVSDNHWYGVNPTLIPSSVVEKAAVGAQRKLLSTMRQDTRLLTTAGEMRETLKMLRSPFKTLFQKLTQHEIKLRNIRRKFFRKGELTKWTKVSSDTWLELSFGVRPLCSDIVNIVATYNQLFEPKEVVHRGRSSAKSTISLPNQVGGSDVYVHTAYMTQVWTARDQLIAATRTQPQQARRHDLGLTALDLMPTLWELVPFSFLADYVVDIGGMLDDFVSWANAPIVWCSRTQTFQSVVTSTTGSLTNPNYAFKVASYGKVEHTAKKVVRQRLYQLQPHLAPQFVLAQRFSFTRGLNVAALIHNFGYSHTR